MGNEHGPAALKNSVRQGFRCELEKNLNGLRDYNMRRNDSSLKELSEIALPQDLISAALMRVSKNSCDQNEMHELVGYVHDKNNDLPEEFNFEGITSEGFHVEHFFSV